jgi:hypothetical protein
MDLTLTDDQKAFPRAVGKLFATELVPVAKQCPRAPCPPLNCLLKEHFR